jgi:hypothetical protein
MADVALNELFMKNQRKRRKTTPICNLRLMTGGLIILSSEFELAKTPKCTSR